MRKALIAPLLLVLFAGYAHAAKNTVVKGLRYSSYKTYTRIVVDLNGPVEYSQNRLSGPDRIFFDLKKCSLTKKRGSSVSVDDGVLKKIRVGQFNGDTVRVVFDLAKKRNFYAFTLENPYRLVIDVYSGKGAERKKPVKTHKSITDKSFPGIRTVVIDPGHGGRDPGAIGSRGLREKDITLSVGKQLGNILKKRHGMKVIYTRTRDRFIPLNERTELANSKKADLFISVHTNASRTRRARGIETYFMNWTNDREAMKVAARENSISLAKMRSMQDSLQMILQDLARKNKNEESMKLAHSVQKSIVSTLKKDYRKVEDLGVKFALFHVLLGAEMPSILVEISFISNREEEKRLANARYKKRIAEAIARGVNSYIKDSTLIAKRAAGSI